MSSSKINSKLKICFFFFFKKCIENAQCHVYLWSGCFYHAMIRLIPIGWWTLTERREIQWNQSQNVNLRFGWKTMKIWLNKWKKEKKKNLKKKQHRLYASWLTELHKLYVYIKLKSQILTWYVNKWMNVKIAIRF